MSAFIDVLSQKLNVTFQESAEPLGFESYYYCDENGNVERIKIYQTELQNLEFLEPIAEHLKVLEIKGAPLINIDYIRNFVRLEELNLYLESITSLRGLDKLKKLKKLSLSCEVVSSLKEIESIDSLVYLKLYCPYPVPSSLNLNSLEKLKTLQLLGVESIDMIQGIKGLKNLELKNNDISEISGMGKCPDLEVLNLSCNQIMKIQGLGELKQLKSLTMGSTEIVKIEGLENLINLEFLFLEHNSIAKIEGLETLCSLKELDLSNSLGESNTPIEKIQGLDHLSKLEKLILTGQRITDLKNIPTENIQLIDVSWNKINHIDFNWIEEIRKPCTINLTGNPIKLIPDKIPKHITIIN